MSSNKTVANQNVQKQKMYNQNVICITTLVCNYSRFLKSNHFKICKHLKSRLFESHISNGLVFKLAIAIVSTIQKLDHLKSGCFFRISNSFRQNVSHLSGFQMVGLPDFRSYSKSRPFATQPLYTLSYPIVHAQAAEHT